MNTCECYFVKNKGIGTFLEEKLKINNRFVLDLLDKLTCSVIIIDKNHKIICYNDTLVKTFFQGNEKDVENKIENFVEEYSNKENGFKEKYHNYLDEVFLNNYSSAKWLYRNKEIRLNMLFDISFMKIVAESDKCEEYVAVVLEKLSSYSDSIDDKKEITLKFKAIVDATPLAVNLWDSEMNNIMCNQKVLEMFEISSYEEYINDFYKFSPLYQPNGITSEDLSKTHFSKTLTEGYNCFKWLHQNIRGEEIPSEITLTKIELEEGQHFIVGFVRDLRSELMGSEENYYENYFLNQFSEKTLLKNISEISNEWFFAVDLRTEEIRHYGVSEEDKLLPVKLGVSFENGLVHEDDEELYYRLIDNMRKGVYEPIDVRYLEKDGSYTYRRLIYQAVFDSEDKLIFVVGKGVDMDDAIELEERSKLDLLTECYNKISSENIICERLEKNPNLNHAFMMIDIDNFKGINDSIGHFYGDEVLKRIAKNIKNNFSANDTVSRIGGDEFLVYIENYSSIEFLENKAKKILESFSEIRFDDQPDLKFSGSVGVSLYPKDAQDYQGLFKSCDRALSQAKLMGKERFIFYSDSFENGSDVSLGKLQNANKLAGEYFDYDLISVAFNILYERNGDLVSINSVLRYLCQKYDADRSYIFETSDEGESYSNTFEWCRNGVESQKNELQGLDKGLLDGLFGKAYNNVVFSNDIDVTFSGDPIHKVFKEQSIKALACVQIEKDGYVKFFIGLDDCTKQRAWNEKEINSLQYVGKLISIILQGEHMRNEIKTLNEYNKFSAFVSDNSNDIVYVVDRDTYELLHLNRAAIEAFGEDCNEKWKGMKCYKLLHNYDAPCSFCNNDLINEESFYEWTNYNEKLEKTFYLKDKLIPFNGKLVKLQFATDVTKLIELESELKEKLREERLLINCIETLHSEGEPKTQIDKLLEMVAKFYDADRCHIFEIEDNDEIVNNTFEWCAENVEPKIHRMKNIQKSSLDFWISLYKDDKGFFVDFADIKLDYSSPHYEALRARNIHSIVTAPIKDAKGRLTGFIGVENARENVKKTDLIRSVSRFVANFLDETELLTELNRLSYYDLLTGLKNRHSYKFEVNNINAANVSSLGIAYVDIKGLGAINNSKGFAFGDKIICRLVEIMRHVFADDVYRVGGDEFIILKKNIEEKEFENSIKELNKILWQENDFKASVGYSWNTSKHKIQSGISNMASSNYHYNEILLKNLDEEIKRGKFVVFLQPQVEFKTGEIKSAEALIRRLDAEGRIHPPIAFLPFYEREAMIHKIDFFVFESVCKLLEEWKVNYPNKEMMISVNFSRNTINEDDIVQKLIEISDKYNIEKRQIVIEITETINSVADERLPTIVGGFKDAGFSISLDDFGSGYSNLSALKLSDFDELKIDACLISDVHTDSKSKVITEVTLNLCDMLGGLVSVGEGIETIEQYNMLKEMNCGKGQGYYMAKPMPIEEFSQKYIEI